MGLDITAYTGLTELRPQADGEYPEGQETSLYNNPDFPGRFDGLKERTIYSYTEFFGFRAGSYGGYNAWREQLAEMAGYPKTPVVRFGRIEEHLSSATCWNGATGPFSELINFADNEGAIGPVVAKKLADDFAAWQEKADAHPDEWFRMKYADWRKAFEMAADNGAVSFH